MIAYNNYWLTSVYLLYKKVSQTHYSVNVQETYFSWDPWDKSLL